MIKILQVPTGLYGTGEQKISRDIGLLRDPNNLEIHYVVFTEAVDRFEPQLQERGCIVHHRPLKGRRPYFYFQLYRTLKALMKKERYDAVHAHCMFQSGIVMLAAKAAGVPIRITHSHNTGKFKHPFSGVYDAVMRRMILANATELVGCGKAAGEFLFGEKAFNKRGKVILNGVELERFRFREDARQAMRSAMRLENCFVIGNVARLSPVKSQAFLIRLMPEILQIRPEAVLLLIGEGPEQANLERLIRELNLEHKVILAGNVSNVEDYLCAMDVFALPSLFEGVPLTLLEAQANGLPGVMSQKVPDEVMATDLISKIPMEDKCGWAHALCAAKRNAPNRYTTELRRRGLDYSNMMKSVYQLYEG